LLLLQQHPLLHGLTRTGPERTVANWSYASFEADLLKLNLSSLLLHRHPMLDDDAWRWTAWAVAYRTGRRRDKGRELRWRRRQLRKCVGGSKNESYDQRLERKTSFQGLLMATPKRRKITSVHRHFPEIPL
jgi:hypothetical protein